MSDKENSRFSILKALEDGEAMVDGTPKRIVDAADAIVRLSKPGKRTFSQRIMEGLHRLGEHTKGVDATMSHGEFTRTSRMDHVHINERKTK